MIIQKKGEVYGTDEVPIHLYMMGDVETIVTSEMPVEVDKIFDSGTFNEDHRVILITGAPGTGKTSLALYFCREWAIDNLSMFDVVAFIQLRDLPVTGTEAITLSDLLLLACHSTGQKKKVISKEMVLKLISPSLNLLLVLDGWDEVPSYIRKPSFVTRILQSMSSQSRILITSRADCLMDLYDVSNQVEIVGFSKKKIHEYIQRALSTVQVQDKVEEGCRKLNEYFLNYPTVQSCCYIPLNAAIITHTFLTKMTLPSASHELLVMLILSSINRKLQDRHSFRKYTSLEDLPQLNQFSMLAFEGLKRNKVIFTQENLTRVGLPCDLPGYGLLRSVASHNSVEKKTIVYHFIHLTIQELLAAYHISRLEEDEQVRVFRDLLYDHRFFTVLQFYAAFTRFSNQGVRNAITGEEFSKEKMALMNIIRCFFEAQICDDQLPQQVISNLNGNLDLADVNMTSLDCMSVAFWGGFAIFLNISHNKIEDIGITHVAAALQKNTTKIFILESCGISNVGAKSLANCLSSNTSLSKLDISHNIIGDKGIADFATALQLNTTLEELHLVSCGISDGGAEWIAQILANCTSLKVLAIRGNEIGVKGFTYIATAFQTCRTLQLLDVGGQTVTDSAVVSLASLCARENMLTNSLLITWSSSCPEITLKHLAECVCDSFLQSLNLCVYIVQPSGTAPVSVEVEDEWFQRVAVGGKDLFDSLVTNQYLKALSLQLGVSNSIWDEDTPALITLHSTAHSVNSARKEKGLYDIEFTINY